MSNNTIVVDGSDIFSNNIKIIIYIDETLNPISDNSLISDFSHDQTIISMLASPKYIKRERCMF